MEKLYYSLELSLAGISIVFLVLIIMSVIIYFLKYLEFVGSEKKEVSKSMSNDKMDKSEDENEIIAVISAAIASIYQTTDFRIDSFTEIMEPVADHDMRKFNMWAKYGRMNIMTNHSNFGKGRLEKWKK